MLEFFLFFLNVVSVKNYKVSERESSLYLQLFHTKLARKKLVKISEDLNSISPFFIFSCFLVCFKRNLKSTNAIN